MVLRSSSAACVLPVPVVPTYNVTPLIRFPLLLLFDNEVNDCDSCSEHENSGSKEAPHHHWSGALCHAREGLDSIGRQRFKSLAFLLRNRADLLHEDRVGHLAVVASKDPSANP